MIAGLKGNISHLEVDHLHINCQGVIWEVWIPFRTYISIKNTSLENITLYIYHHISDRSQKLFGFFDAKDKEFFIAMKSLQGIGEMTALRILSFLTAEDIYRAALNNDNDILEKIPKIKSKTSEKILFELNRNLKKFSALVDNNIIPTQSRLDSKDTAVLALVQLGFDEKSAIRQVDQVIKTLQLEDTGEIIKEVLKNI